jgi:hypothetical protein
VAHREDGDQREDSPANGSPPMGSCRPVPTTSGGVRDKISQENFQKVAGRQDSTWKRQLEPQMTQMTQMIGSLYKTLRAPAG